MSYFGQQYPLYVPPSISGNEKVKITTTTRTTMTETVPLTREVVIFGATGDLCRRKLIPALYNLHTKGLLPDNLVIVGTSRREISKDAWLSMINADQFDESFRHRLAWQPSDLGNPESLGNLPWAEDRTYFLSVPPERYESAIVNLTDAGLLDDADRSRVIIEKPFGTDYQSANHLQSVVSGRLREKQVYRIDHYLGKDTVNNILATRFSNILFEPLWNRNFISEVQIFATETIGCEGRAQYYEHAGAVRDMLQNHMLQVLSLIAMEPPCRLDAKEIRREKTKVLAAARLGQKTLFGQYVGYRDEEGVSSNSPIPTFVSGDIYIDNWRWKGVPFYFMTGKKMPYQGVEVVIKLKAPPLALYEGEVNDRIVIRIQPDPHLDVQIDIKSPGLGEHVELATLTHKYPEGALDGYVTLFYDALNCDQSHFVHGDEVLESWRIVDDLLCTGDSCRIRTTPYLYHEGNWGPSHKAEFITHWDYPS